MQAADRNAEVETREQTAEKKAGEVVKRDGKKQDNKKEGVQNKAVDGDSATGGEEIIKAASAMSGAELRAVKESAEVGTVDGLLGERERTKTLMKDIAMEAEVAESKRTGGLKPGEKTPPPGFAPAEAAAGSAKMEEGKEEVNAGGGKDSLKAEHRGKERRLSRVLEKGCREGSSQRVVRTRR
ncbi:Modification methylase SacI [Dissostichus eleginoides]|uniref:Modification methylase SacI n=1 Tax=Dissostichus eleginoides TaxID=100907 RepID=A0AAD9FP33_DISEL|nr:Modification methylase SacI [Dissostichus eleginoides]